MKRRDLLRAITILPALAAAGAQDSDPKTPEDALAQGWEAWRDQRGKCLFPLVSQSGRPTRTYWASFRRGERSVTFEVAPYPNPYLIGRHRFPEWTWPA